MMRLGGMVKICSSLRSGKVVCGEEDCPSFFLMVGDMEYIMDLSTRRKVKGINNLSDTLSDAVGAIEMRI